MEQLNDLIADEYASYSSSNVSYDSEVGPSSNSLPSNST